jgi:RNA polymerase sigma-70 factor (ECF subfamily)
VQDDRRDLMQQTLLACVEGRARFRRDASFRTYLYQTARYQLYAYYRKRNRESGHDPAITGLPDSASSPSRVLARRQDERMLLEALRRMPMDDQIVLELSFWEDLTGREIAEVLGSPEGTVRGRLARATERLRREMQSTELDKLQDTADDLPAWALRLRKEFA